MFDMQSPFCNIFDLFIDALTKIYLVMNKSIPSVLLKLNEITLDIALSNFDSKHIDQTPFSFFVSCQSTFAGPMETKA